MLQMDQWGLVFAAGVTSVILVVLAVRFSSRARLRRRLRKTHGRVVSRARRPSVQLNVKTPEE